VRAPEGHAQIDRQICIGAQSLYEGGIVKACNRSGKRSKITQRGFRALASSVGGAALILGCAAGLRADAVSISDQTLADSDWNETIVTNTVPAAWTTTVQQYADGGNPGSFRGQAWNWSPTDTSFLATVDAFNKTAYNPSSQGAIGSVDFNIDDYIADVKDGTNGRVIGFEPALVQGDSIYSAPSSYLVTSSTQWHTNTWNGLSAAAFAKLTGSGSNSPDFSASGAPITFGYYSSLTVGGADPYQLFHGVDNFNVAVNQAISTPTHGPYLVNADIGLADADHSYSGSGVLNPSGSGTQWNVVPAGQWSSGQMRDSNGNQTSVGYRFKVDTSNLQLTQPLTVRNDVDGLTSRVALMNDAAWNGVYGDTVADKYGAEMYVTGLEPNGHYSLALYGIAYGGVPNASEYVTKFTVNGADQTTTDVTNDNAGGNNVVYADVTSDANGEVRVQLHNANFDPGTGTLMGGFWALNGFQVQSLATNNPTWSASSGNWSGAGNWTNGTPAGAGGVAVFGQVAAATAVNVDAPKTVGVLGFQSTQKYTISGSAITLDNNGYDSMINVSQGQHEIAAPLTVPAGKKAEIVIANNAGLKLSGTLSGKLSRVSLGSGSNLDIGSNPLVISYFGSNPYPELFDAAKTAYDSGKWDQPGLTSSEHSDPHYLGGFGLGIVDNAQAGLKQWQGQDVDDHTILVLPTWGGDANLDGKINIDDYGRIDSNVGQSGTVFGWYNGDFNYDGKINIDDYGIIDGNIGKQSASPTGITAVPEPSAVAGLIMVSMAAGWRRRKGRSQSRPTI
jgi:hypothetical protein